MWYISPVCVTYKSTALAQNSIQHFDILRKTSQAKVDHMWVFLREFQAQILWKSNVHRYF